MDIERLKKSMTNIRPNEEQIGRIESLRIKYKTLLLLLNDITTDSREKSIAVTKLEESLMWAVKSIVLEEK